MLTPTPRLLKAVRRLPLSTKQSKPNYYKGNSVGSMGTIDQFGRFKVDWDKVRTYRYPEKGAVGEIFMSKEMEQELKEERVRRHYEQKADEDQPERVKYEKTKPSYTILFPDEKRSVGNDLLSKWRLEKIGVQEA